MASEIDKNNNITLNLTKENLPTLKTTGLEGILVHKDNEFISIPYKLELSENGNSINGIYLYKLKNPLIYKIIIRKHVYKILEERKEYSTIINRWGETLTLKIS